MKHGVCGANMPMRATRFEALGPRAPSRSHQVWRTLMPLTGRPLEAPVHIPRLLHAGLGQAPDDMALVSTATHCTWRDLDRASDNLAGNLLGMGLSPGDRVASLMPNRTALIIHYIACMKSGLVGVPLNYRYTVSEIDRALEVSEASVLLPHGERSCLHLLHLGQHGAGQGGDPFPGNHRLDVRDYLRCPRFHAQRRNSTRRLDLPSRQLHLGLWSAWRGCTGRYPPYLRKPAHPGATARAAPDDALDAAGDAVPSGA